MLRIKDRLKGITVNVEPVASYLPPWEHDPSKLVTFEAYSSDFLGLEDGDLSLQDFNLTTSGGWVVGCRRVLTLPQVRYLNFDDLLARVFAKQVGRWTHDGSPPSSLLVAVIPDHLPGAGMVIVSSLTALAPATSGSLIEQQQTRRSREAQMLRSLGYKEVPDGEPEGHPAGD